MVIFVVLSKSCEFPNYCSSLEIAGELSELLGAEGLWSLEWEAKSSAPDHLRQAAQSSADAKENGVVLHLGHAVVLEEHTRVGVYVWPWVLGLTLSKKDIWHNLVDLADQLEHIVVWEVLEGKLSLTSVSWIGLSEHGVSVAWHHSAGLERVPDEIVELLVADVLTAQVLSELGEPDEHLLVGETVEWTGEAVHGGGEGQVWIGQGGANQVRGVSADVAALVVGVDGKVKSHELSELLIVVTDHIGKVLGPIGIWVDNAQTGAVSVEVVVDLGGNGWQLGDQVHAVLEAVLPVLALVGALGVLSGEDGLTVKRVNSGAELGHWVQVAWEVVQHLDDMSWEIGGASPLLRELLDFGLGWDLAGDEKPEETLWKWLAALLGGWEDLLALWDGKALESDALDWVQNRGLPHHSLHASHTAVDHVDVDFADFGLAMLGSEGLDFFSLLWDKLNDLLSEGGDVSLLGEGLGGGDELSESHFTSGFL